jgi:hypothetical protein
LRTDGKKPCGRKKSKQMKKGRGERKKEKGSKRE